MSGFDDDGSAIVTKCGHCEHMFTEADVEACPACDKGDALMDMTADDVAVQWNARNQSDADLRAENQRLRAACEAAMRLGAGVSGEELRDIARAALDGSDRARETERRRAH